MKVYCLISPSHKELYDAFFRPSVSKEFEIVPIDSNTLGEGDFLSDSFKECILQKLHAICSSIKRNWGEIIVWSDVDIIFLELTPTHIISAMDPDIDYCAQQLVRGHNEVCGGFYAIRCNPQTLALFERVIEITQSITKGNEQDALNLALSKDMVNGIKWKLFDDSYYARTHGIRLPQPILIYHATCLTNNSSIRQKVEQLSTFKGFLSWNSLNRWTYYAFEIPSSVLRKFKNLRK